MKKYIEKAILKAKNFFVVYNLKEGGDYKRFKKALNEEYNGIEIDELPNTTVHIKPDSEKSAEELKREIFSAFNREFGITNLLVVIPRQYN